MRSLIRKAGGVKRFHTVPTIGNQTVAEHSYNLCMLLLEVTEGKCSTNLLKAALYHDIPEIATGDIPATTKWSSVELHGALLELEEVFINEHKLDVPLTLEEMFLLKFCDMLELVLYCLDQLKLGNRNMFPIAQRGIMFLSKMGATNPLCLKELDTVVGKLRRYEYDESE